MANNKIQIKRTSVSGRAANTSTLTSPGELGLNMTDGIMYSTNGSVVFEIGANNTNVNVSGNLTIKGIIANGSLGTSGYVLKSDGTSSYWGTDGADVGAANQILYRNSSNVLTTSSGLQYDGSAVKVNGRIESLYQAGEEGGELYLNKPATNTSIIDGITIDLYQNKLRFFEAGGNNRGAYIDITAAANGVGTNLLTGGGGSGTVTSVGSGNGLTGGPITGSGTLSVLANTGIIANATGVFVNSSYIATLTANNATNLGGVAAASYVQNTDSRTLSGNLVISGTYFNPSANTILLGNSIQRWVLSANSGDFSSTVNAVTSVNSALLTVGTAFTANSTLVNAAAINITNQTNTATFHATTSANVGANLRANTTAYLVASNSTVNTIITATSFTQANTTATPFVANVTGLYHTGTVNAASHTVGTTAVINATAYYFGTINATSNGSVLTATTLTIGNSSVNATVNSTTFTGTALTANNSTNLGGVAAASYVQNTDSRTLSGNINFSGANTNISGNLTIASTGELIITNGAAIYANGTAGSSGQVLTTNGSSVYWSTSSGGGFTNGSSISVNNFVLTGAFSANSSNGTSGQILVTTGTGAYWSNSYVLDLLYANNDFAFRGTGAYVYPKVNTAVTFASPLAWNSDATDQYNATALSANLTFNADSGTPRDGQKIMFRIKDNGSARTLTWTTGTTNSFRAVGITLPTSTVASKTLYVGAIYNSSDSRWDVIATSLES